MTHHLHHLAGPYAVDALGDDEHAAFEAHLPACEICSREVREFQAAAAVLASGAIRPPPPALKAPVMARVAATRQVSPLRNGAAQPERAATAAPPGRSHRARRMVAAAAAAVVLALGAAAAVTALGTTSPDGDALVALLAQPDASVTSLGPEAGAGATGSMQVVWSPGRDLVAVLADGVEGTGPGRAYALWLVQPDGVVAAGTFVPSEGQVRAVLAVDDLRAQGWAVTIEPAGGSPRPTGEILYSGTV